jgi:hypothetical protein
MGFFLLARELGMNLYHDERSFFAYELKRIHDYWSRQNPFGDYGFPVETSTRFRAGHFLTRPVIGKLSRQ